jgi:DNA-directed RNA polymerase specialized sigma24 family protein
VGVRTIAGNLVRRAGVPRSGVSFQELPEGLQEPEDRDADPADLAVRGEVERRLAVAWILFLCHYAQAWNRLSSRDRRTLHLVEVQGLSYLEAGRLLGVGRSNMKMIVFRARKRIAQRMREAMRPASGRRATALGPAR